MLHKAKTEARKGSHEEDHLTQGQSWDRTNVPTVTRKAIGKNECLQLSDDPNWAPSRGEETRWSGANISQPSSRTGAPKSDFVGLAIMGDYEED